MIQNEPMFTQEGLNLITHFEGCRLEAYKDQAGLWTIGYGSRKGVTPKMVITPEVAEDFLMADIAEVEIFLHRTVNCELTDNEYSALVSFVYNIGSGNFRMSRMYLYLNANQKKKASNEFERWIYVKKHISKGLQNRRKAEKELFLKKEVAHADTDVRV